ncbi:DUF6783 domain-containing protein [Anaerobutyricum hallii]
MCIPIYGRFRLNEGVGCVNRMKAKYTSNFLQF